MYNVERARGRGRRRVALRFLGTLVSASFTYLGRVSMWPRNVGIMPHLEGGRRFALRS